MVDHVILRGETSRSALQDGNADERTVDDWSSPQPWAPNRPEAARVLVRHTQIHPKAEDSLDLYPDPATHSLLDPLAEALVAIADTGVRVAAPVVAEPPARSGVVIEKLTKNVNESHLREIFGTFGQIRDLDMPMNRSFNTNRGTAYILYTSEADAEAAIAHMHESQIDGAVINVSIVLPRRKFSPSPPLARRTVNLDPRAPIAAAPSFRPPPQVRRRSPLPPYGVIVHARDRFLRGPVPHLEEEARVEGQEEEDGEKVQPEMAVEKREAQVTLATAVMKTGGAGAGAVPAEAEEAEVVADVDVRTIDLAALEFGTIRNHCITDV
ncbi:RNA recognition domain-containing protein [Drepanopeziza brunnea f. sp. 'multigermtubi' MB_m1]|uniref:RNA recognition domain-containing protein n=1 Tax=Marssonina brunnea f. sp. multigermtubi (strain MB_m1) TaxID=1072389 RepID=K1WAR2_MARBU|nr:RNA recognition domain-containing protein [Drepanopeziza brunnea f. sp. 'multigermtubi' MB_m1]EKD14375.1 RNA recognition domain-containing protein [Drepanopeziza brunnea f. sp. 'multigermtubi' MB_m1]